MSSENRIFVDAARAIGEIDPNIYGFNIEHIHRDSTGSSIIYGAIFDEGSPLSDGHGFRKDVIEACKRIKVPMLRWPGGNFASGYHWLNGVGPRDERPRLFELAWQSEESNRFGTDEFIEFCKLVNAEPWITVNAGPGTAEEACQWLEYSNGIDKPVLNVFRLLAKLGGIRLQLTSAAGDSFGSDQFPPEISGIASINGSDEIQIFLCSHHDDWDIHGLTQVKVEIMGLDPNNSYRLRQILIDSVHSNSYSAWIEMGEPQNPSEEQLRILERASMPKTVEETTVTNTDDKCAFTVPLAAHSVCLVELIPVEI